MPSRNITAKLLLLAALVIGATVPATLIGEGHQNLPSESQKESSKIWEPEAIRMAPEPTDPAERASRYARSKRYDGSGTRPLTEQAPHYESIISVERFALPPFPISQSDVVVLGEVVDLQPYFSNDKTIIYTEYTVQIEEVLKNDNTKPLNLGDSIIMERIGGVLQLPSGIIVRLKVTGLGAPPRAGRRYLLFLKRNNEGGKLLHTHAL